MNIQRYSCISNSSEPREIILLKSFPCKWGRCSFCDYIHDNSEDESLINQTNLQVISQVTGKPGVLQVINSGSCFELPDQTMQNLKMAVAVKGVKKLYFESHWLYRERLAEIRDFFSLPIVFITGIETFDNNFRNKVLKKGVEFSEVAQIKKYFQSICLMVGMKGQTREMIKTDIDILLQNFDHGTVNLYIDNSTQIKADKDLQQWFLQEFAWLKNEKKIDLLVNNTDFGVGGELKNEQ